MFEGLSNWPVRRSRSGGKLGGVAQGLADYLQMDVTLLRLVWLLAVPLTAGLALVLYAVLWVVLPVGEPAFGPQASYGAKRGTHLAGVLLLLLGIGVLLGQFHLLGWARLLWPLTLVILGATLLLRRD